MGFMTQVGILNDMLSTIKDSPKQFVEGVCSAINLYPNERQPYIVGQTTVLPSHHADEPVVTLAYANNFVDFRFARTLDEQILKHRVQMARRAQQTLAYQTSELEKALVKKMVEQGTPESLAETQVRHL